MKLPLNVYAGAAVWRTVMAGESWFPAPTFSEAERGLTQVTVSVGDRGETKDICLK